MVSWLFMVWPFIVLRVASVALFGAYKSGATRKVADWRGQLLRKRRLAWPDLFSPASIRRRWSHPRRRVERQGSLRQRSPASDRLQEEYDEISPRCAPGSSRWSGPGRPIGRSAGRRDGRRELRAIWPMARTRVRSLDARP